MAAVMAIVLLGCDRESNTGGIGWPCNHPRQCGQGLYCGAGECSTGVSGRACDNASRYEQCTDGIICRRDLNTCGGLAGDDCITDGHCNSGMICVNEACTISNGDIGAACRVRGHCNSDACGSGNTCEDGRPCMVDSTCDTGEICGGGICGSGSAAGEGCVADNTCAGVLICAGAAGNLECSMAGDGMAGSVCGDPGHCTGSNLACGDTTGTCGIAAGQSCVAGECAGSMICGGGICGSGSAAGEGCAAGECAGALICGGGICGSGSAAGEGCTANNTCAGALVCGSNTCQATGTTWAERAGSTTNLGFATDIHYDNNLWVAVGWIEGEDPITGNTLRTGTITTSADGTTWTEQTSNVSGRLNNIHYATDSTGSNGRWVAVGNSYAINSNPNGGIITTSADGTTWTARTSNVSGRLNDIHHANNLWVAVGNGGEITTSADNGTTWTARTSNVSGLLNNIHYATDSTGSNGRWVAVGTATDHLGNTIITDTITTSPDGTTWTARTSNVSGQLNDIHHANNLWVAVGNGGAITTSADNGTTWTARTSNVSGQLNDIHHANNLWVAVGNGGAITTSADGTTWADTTLGAQININDGGLNDIHYANNSWVAVGADYPSFTDDSRSGFDSAGNLTYPAAIFTSTDNGTTWERQSANRNSTLTDIHYANNLWVAVGWVIEAYRDPMSDTSAPPTITAEYGILITAP